MSTTVAPPMDTPGHREACYPVARSPVFELTTELFHRDYPANLALVMRMLAHFKAHPRSVNKKKAIQWVNAQKNQFRRQLAMQLVRNIVYISFEKLFFGMRDVVKQVLEYIQSKYPEGHRVYLIGEGAREKSNYILLVMAWYWLKQMRKHDVYQFEFVSAGQPPHEWWQRFAGSPVVYFDDMSYSGGQLTHSFRSLYYINTVITGDAVPDFILATYAMTTVAAHKLSTVARRNVSMETYSTVRQADVAARRLTPEDAQKATQIQAIQSLSQAGFRDFVPSPFKVIYHRLVRSLPDAVGLQNWYYMTQLFQAALHAPTVCAYFDYKIADDPSTFKGLLHCGFVPPVHWPNPPPSYVEASDIFVGKSGPHTVFHQLSLIPDVVLRHLERSKTFIPLKQLDINFDRPDTAELIPFIRECGASQLRAMNPTWDADLRALNEMYRMQIAGEQLSGDRAQPRAIRNKYSSVVDLFSQLFSPNILESIVTGSVLMVYVSENWKAEWQGYSSLKAWAHQASYDVTELDPSEQAVLENGLAALNRVKKYKECIVPFYKAGVQTSQFPSPPVSDNCKLTSEDVAGFYDKVLKLLWLNPRHRRRGLERMRIARPRDFCALLHEALPPLHMFTRRGIRLVDTIQSGARGAVLLGVDRQNQRYAVKFSILLNEQTLQDVHLEANAMRQAYELGIGIPLIDEEVVHLAPNIGMQVLLMPVVGAVLKQFLQRNNPGAARAQALPPGITDDDVVAAVLRLIDRMDEVKVMHGDFHPGNIVLEFQPTSVPKVVAKVLDVPRLRSEPCFRFVAGYDGQYLLSSGLPKDEYEKTPLYNKLQSALTAQKYTSRDPMYFAYTSHLFKYKYGPMDPTNPTHLQVDADLKRRFEMDFEGYRYPTVPGCRR